MRWFTSILFFSFFVKALESWLKIHCAVSLSELFPLLIELVRHLGGLALRKCAVRRMTPLV